MPMFSRLRYIDKKTYMKEYVLYVLFYLRVVLKVKPGMETIWNECL